MGEMERFNRKARPMHADVPYVACAVCKLAIAEVWRQAELLRAEAPRRKVGEDDLIELATGICNADLEEGDWLAMYDLTQKGAGTPVKLEKQEYMGECRRECRTIAHACAKVFDEHREDIAELLWKRSPDTEEKLASRVCTKWAKVCPATAVPASYERTDEYWMPMDEDSWKMRNMEKTMNKLSNKHGTQQVKFVDAMGGMMMGPDGWDEDEAGGMGGMFGGMGGGMGGMGDSYGDDLGGTGAGEEL
jgi:hypothetical protein